MCVTVVEQQGTRFRRRFTDVVQRALRKDVDDIYMSQGIDLPLQESVEWNFHWKLTTHVYELTSTALKRPMRFCRASNKQDHGGEGAPGRWVFQKNGKKTVWTLGEHKWDGEASMREGDKTV